MAEPGGSGTTFWREAVHRRVSALALIVALALADLAAGAALQAQQTNALYTSYIPIVSTPPPPFTTSYYIESSNPALFFKLGCATAVEMAERRISDGIVILFFGRPAYQETIGYGTVLPGRKGSFASIAQIQADAVAWIKGYLNGYDNGAFHCTVPQSVRPRLVLALATTNEPLFVQIPTAASVTSAVIDPDPDLGSHGKAWASMINYLGDDLKKTDPQQPLSIAGANDIELAWNTAQESIRWVSGYGSLGKYRYYNVGSCDGCPERVADAPKSGPYAYDWTAGQIWTVSISFGAQVLPQIYNERGAQARQWATLAQVAASLGLSPPTFVGSLSQYYACIDQEDICKGVKNTPTVGWRQFEQELKEQRLSMFFKWSTDVRWNFDEARFGGGNR